MDKKSWYSIPYWDRMKLIQLAEPNFSTGVEHLRVLKLDRTHYILTQLVFNNDMPVKYEMLRVTIHGYEDEVHYHYKSYTPLKVVWFE